MFIKQAYVRKCGIAIKELYLGKHFSAFQELLVLFYPSPSFSTRAWPAPTTRLSGLRFYTSPPSSSSSSSDGQPHRSHTCRSSPSWWHGRAKRWSSLRTGEQVPALQTEGFLSEIQNHNSIYLSLYLRKPKPKRLGVFFILLYNKKSTLRMFLKF